MYLSRTVRKTGVYYQGEVAFAWSDVLNDLLFTNNVQTLLVGFSGVGAHKGFVNLINKYANDLNITKENLEGRDVIRD